MTEKDQGIWLANEPCPDCDSKDNLSIYEKPDGTIDGYCQTLNCPEGQYKSNNKLAKDEYLAEKYDIVIFSTKVKPDRPLVNGKTGAELVWEWLEKYNLSKYIKEVTSEKPRAVFYIDDKAIRFIEWEDTLNKITNKYN